MGEFAAEFMDAFRRAGIFVALAEMDDQSDQPDEGHHHEDAVAEAVVVGFAGAVVVEALLKVGEGHGTLRLRRRRRRFLVVPGIGLSEDRREKLVGRGHRDPLCVGGDAAVEHFEHFRGTFADVQVGIAAGDVGDFAHHLEHIELADDPQRGHAVERVGIGEHAAEALAGGGEVELADGLDGGGSFAVVA